MMYVITIRNNKTNQIRSINVELDWDENSEFLWTEGNYSCDCNRHLFFIREVENNPTNNRITCGETEYSVLYTKLPNGTKILLDDDHLDHMSIQ